MLHSCFSIFRSGALLAFLLFSKTGWAVVPMAVIPSSFVVANSVDDADNDGIPDSKDLCPGTPVGTAVNAYGCPQSLASCDFTTATITLTSKGGSGNGTMRYVLADSLGTILQVSNTPGFSGLTGSHTYMALSINHDGPVANLTPGQVLSSVTATCLDWSDALLIRVCVSTLPPPPPTGCDYNIGDVVTLTSTGGSTTAGTQSRYVLVNSSGAIMSVTTSPTFATTGLDAGLYRAYAVIYTDDQSILNLQAGKVFSSITATCIDTSSPLLLTLCTAVCQSICVPIRVTRLVKNK